MRKSYSLLGGVGLSLLGCATVDAVPVDAGADATSAPSCQPGALAEGCPCEPALYAKRACYEGPSKLMGFGACRAGVRECANGVVSGCVGQVLPGAEVCNGIDDDCDGVIDNVQVDAGAGDGGVQTYENKPVTCSVQGIGACALASTQCVSGVASCVAIVPQGEPESCNGIDDDCNGLVDDGLNKLPACSPSELPDGGVLRGECKRGVSSCVAGQVTCAPRKPSTEICNGIDDDCDGVIDNPPPANVNGGFLNDIYGGQCSCGCGGATGCVGCSHCPYVFVHDGRAFRYATTIGGAALIGRAEHVRSGKPVDFRPLWVRLDGASTHGGRARAKVSAADDEIVYLSSAALMIVRHPAGYEVFSSTSRQGSIHEAPRAAETVALSVDAMRTPTSASWMGREDVTRQLSTDDDVAARFDARVDNFYELDFGAVGDSAHARLVLDGHKVKMKTRELRPEVPVDVRPRLEIEQSDGTFVEALPLDTPRGDKKAVVFDLGALSWPTGRYRMRVYTGTHEGGRALWMVSRARLCEERAAEISIERASLATATLAFSGVPSVADPSDRTRPLRAVDDGRGPLTAEHRTYGRFTRYGEVSSLLASDDERLVVMRRGDSVELAFDVPEAPAGSRHTLFLVTSLVWKPRAPLGLEPSPLTERVEPMPYPGMAHYPPARAPEGEAYARYLADWQTREYTAEDSRWGA